MHKRSLQGELIAILEEATSPGSLTVDELREAVRRLGPPTLHVGRNVTKAFTDANQKAVDPKRNVSFHDLSLAHHAGLNFTSV